MFEVNLEEADHQEEEEMDDEDEESLHARTRARASLSPSPPPIDSCPLYLIVYICSFLPMVEGGNARAVSRKWYQAVQQLDLINAYLEFSNAECINQYTNPLYDTMCNLASFPIQLDTVVDHCTSVVKQSVEENISPLPVISTQKDGLRNYVFENCKMFFKNNSTLWVYDDNYAWYTQATSYCNKSDAGANSEVDEDPNFEDDDDGFRYFEDEEEEEYPGAPRYNDKGAEEDGDVGYYGSYPDESAREIARTREEMGYLSLYN